MEIKDDYDFRDLKNKCWSGAKDTLDMISDNGYEDELMSHLEDVFSYLRLVTSCITIHHYAP